MLQYFQVHINVFNEAEGNVKVFNEAEDNVKTPYNPLQSVIILGQSIMANITSELLKKMPYHSCTVLQVDHQKFLTEKYVNVSAVVSCGELFEIRRYVKCKYYYNLFLVKDRVSGISRKMGLRQVEQDFSSFFDKFLAYMMIFQSL